MLRKSDIPVILECIKFSALECMTEQRRRALWRLYFDFADEFKIEVKRKRVVDWKFYGLLTTALVVAICILWGLID